MNFYVLPLSIVEMKEFYSNLYSYNTDARDFTLKQSCYCNLSANIILQNDTNIYRSLQIDICEY